MKFIVSLVFAMFVTLSSSAFAQVPCGPITDVTAQNVTFRLNELDVSGVVTSVGVYRGLTAGSLAFQKSFDLPAANADGSYTVTLTGTGYTSDVTTYIAVNVSGPSGQSSLSEPVAVPALVSGACPAPHTPEQVTVVAPS